MTLALLDSPGFAPVRRQSDFDAEFASMVAFDSPTDLNPELPIEELNGITPDAHPVAYPDTNHKRPFMPVMPTINPGTQRMKLNGGENPNDDPDAKKGLNKKPTTVRGVGKTAFRSRR